MAAESADSSEVVIGTDQRVRIRTTNIYPWRAIAMLELYNKNDKFVGHCTGTFIGADVLLTAGHCLWSEKDGFTWNIRVVPGKDAGYEPYGSQYAKDWWVPDSYIDTKGSPDYDWGVIKMNSSTLGQTVGWFQIGVLSTATLSRPDFTPAIVGFPGDVTPEYTMWGDIKDRFSTVSQYELKYDIDTAPGESGSAIFSANTNATFLGTIVGVHTSGGTLNRGNRMEPDLLDDILEGCRQMGCTIDWYIEQGEPTPTATRPPTATPTLRPAATATRPVAASAVTYYGLAVSATIGQTVIAFISEGSRVLVCGRGIVYTDATAGLAYEVDVSTDAQVRGCGSPGRSVTFYFAPMNGRGARLATNSAQWQSGGPNRFDVAFGPSLSPRNFAASSARDGVY